MKDYFKPEELQCKCGCGKQYFDKNVLRYLNELRSVAGFPFVISSGYRCAEHPVEKAKGRLGEHQTGKAVDVLCNGKRAMTLTELAIAFKVPRVGISQKGDHTQRFIHLGWNYDFPSPAFWSY